MTWREALLKLKNMGFTYKEACKVWAMYKERQKGNRGIWGTNT